MKRQTITFGFCTKDFTTLNDDLKKCNGGRLPSPSEIKKITIAESDKHYEYMHVHVVLFKLLQDA